MRTRIIGSNQHRTKEYIIRPTVYRDLCILFMLAGLVSGITSGLKPVKVHSPLAISPSPVVIETAEVKVDREQKLYDYLRKHNSPLAGQSALIIEASDEYGIDYTLIPAIAGKESSFGKAIKQGSYNAWGIMAWDEAGNRSVRIFNSWKEAINFEAKLLAENYRWNMNRGIQQKYCPDFECSPTWASDITSFSEAIIKM